MDDKLTACIAYMRHLRSMLEHPQGADHPPIAATLAKGIHSPALRAEMERMAAEKAERDKALASALDAGIKALEGILE